MDKPPAAASAALPPLEDWRTEHVEQWRLSLPENARIKFKAFFDNLPPEADGSTLASYDLPGLLLVFPKLGAFAPELYAKLQQLKLPAPSGPARAQLRGDVILSECSRTPSQVVNAGVAWEALSIRPTHESAFFPAAWRAPSQTFNVVCPPESVTEEQVQEAWGQAALSWSSTNPEVLLLDAHDVESLPATPFQHALKPDFVGFNCLNVMNRIHAEGSGEIELAVRPTRAPGLSAAFSIDLIGEIKKPGNFTPANCGQVLVYAQTSFYVHPDRTHLYAFLANDTHIQFFFFKRQDNTDGIGEVKTTLPLPLSLGTHWLSVLLSQSRVELGRTAPSTFSLIPIRNTVQSFTVKIGSLLGSGRSSVVYLAMTNERDFVVKCFQQSSQPQFASEKEHLLKLQQFAPDGHFPMLLGTAPPESGLVLVLQPRAAPLLSHRGQRARFALTCEEATDLFATLRILHREAHLIHRDISPGNVYHDIPEKLNKVMIADFGFSVRAGICATAAGTLRYAANEVLERWGTGHQIKWVPRYDIESAVKLCFTQVHDCDPNYTPPHSNNSSELLQWWRGMAARKLLLQHALACARKFDQDLDPPMHLYTDVGNLVAKFWDI